MKVLLVAAGYPPDVRGGTERSVQSLARGLARAGHDVVVVAGSDQFADGFRVSECVDVDPGSGCEIHVRRIHRDDLFYEHWHKSRSPRVGRAFEAILCEERADVVHVHHWLRLTRDVIHRATTLGYPTVLTLHDFSLSCLVVHRLRPDDLSFCRASLAADPCLSCVRSQPPGMSFLSDVEQAAWLEDYQRVGERELRSAGQVLALSNDQKTQLAEFLGPRQHGVEVRVLGLAADLEFAESVESVREPLPPPRVGRHKLVLGTWGSLHRLKGVDLILDAMTQLDEALRSELHVAGVEVDPAFKAELLDRAKGLDVHFHGAFESDSLGSHPVTHVHVVVHASRARETWGLTVDEALALRLPMVLPRIGAFLERIPDGSGAVYFEPGDAGSLARALARLQTDDELLPRLRDRLPEVRGVVPSVGDYVSRMVGVYEEVIGNGVRQVDVVSTASDADVERRLAAWDRACAEYLDSRRDR